MLNKVLCSFPAVSNGANKWPEKQIHVDRHKGKKMCFDEVKIGDRETGIGAHCKTLPLFLDVTV